MGVARSAPHIVVGISGQHVYTARQYDVAVGIMDAVEVLREGCGMTVEGVRNGKR